MLEGKNDFVPPDEVERLLFLAQSQDQLGTTRCQKKLHPLTTFVLVILKLWCVFQSEIKF